MPRTPILGLPYPGGNDNPSGMDQIQALALALDGADPQARGAFIIGEVRLIAVATAPPGWLECNGAARSRTTYARLFAVIQTTFGQGDGTTTFNVPDCRQRALVAAGSASGLTARAMGAVFGTEAHALATGELPSHNHGLSGNTGAVGDHTHGGTTGGESQDHSHGLGNVPINRGGYWEGKLYAAGNLGGPYAVGGWPENTTQTGGRSAGHTHGFTTNAGGSHSHTLSGNTSNAGSGNAHPNVPPSIAIPAYIFAGA